jgi:hypothetical protein
MGDRLHFQKNQCSKRLKNRLNDLKLASAGIWLSITEQKPTAIITRDSDFIRILMMAIKIMGSDFFMPNNDFFRDSMINFPVVAYFSDDMDKYHSILDSSRLRFFKKFCYPGLDCYENRSINQRVGDFFRKVA